MEKCKGQKSVKSSINLHENRRIDPSFKSKRYRDKLRYEIKSLEGLIPVDRTSLNRKLDSQTVFRLILAYFRTKQFFQVSTLRDNLQKEWKEEMKPDDKQLLQSLDGFIILLSSDGMILYVSDNVLQYIGFNQVDLLHRCIYGIVHPDDHSELQINLEQTLSPVLLSDFSILTNTEENETCKPLSFICRMKYFNGSSAGYLKMHCSGKILYQPEVQTNSRSSNQMVYLFVRPFMYNDVEILCHERKEKTFWSKHEMDLRIIEMDAKCKDLLGFEADEVRNSSFYALLHPEDLSTFVTCHKHLMESTEVQTIYFRLEAGDKRWKWFQSRGKVLSKNSKKFSIVFSHCPLSEDDSTFIRQEATIRHKYGIHDLQQRTTTNSCSRMWPEESTIRYNLVGQMTMYSNPQSDDLMLSLQSANCPSSWHMLSDRHSPVLPSNHVAHKIMQQEKQRQYLEYKRQQTENLFVNNFDNMDFTPIAFNSYSEHHCYKTDFQIHPNFQEVASPVLPSTIVYVPNPPSEYSSVPHAFYEPCKSFQTIRPQYIHQTYPNIYWPNYRPTQMIGPVDSQSNLKSTYSNFVSPVTYNLNQIAGQFTVPQQVIDTKESTVTLPTPPCVVSGKSDVKALSSRSPDTDDAVHMKIVESTLPEDPSRHVDLPSIGSFLEYLNEV